MAEFLSMRGIIKKDELNKYREELQRIENSSGVYSGRQESGIEIRNRRSSSKFEEKCCCPPKNVYMPTFITDHKFDELVDHLKEEKTDNEQ